MMPVPLPAQVTAREGLAQLADTRLWYRDTGGDGTPIVLLHPASGSALIWGYQQPVLAKAGYRVIAYSRRNYYNSDPVPKDTPGTAAGDLHALIEFLGVKRFHLVASAAGGSVASDYALLHPERLLSLVIADNSAGVRDGDIANAAAAIKGQGFRRHAGRVSRARPVLPRGQSRGHPAMGRACPQGHDRRRVPARAPPIRSRPPRSNPSKCRRCS